MKKEIKELIDALLYMVLQHCHTTEYKTYWKIDNSCLSANERATQLLESFGVLYGGKNGRIYKFKKN